MVDALGDKFYSLLLEHETDKVQLAALPGGTTAQHIYPLIQNAIERNLNYKFLMTDERKVSLQDARSNLGGYLKNVCDPSGSRFLNMLDTNAEKIIGSYSLGPVFLGFGLDGHFASIFNSHQYNTQNSLLVNTISSCNEHRLSISIDFIRKAKAVSVVFVGAEKKRILVDSRKNLLIHRLIAEFGLKIEMISDE